MNPKQSIYTLVGATGNIGNRLAKILLAKGATVRAIARNQDKLKELTSLGAQAFIGSIEEAAFLTKAFSGATAIFTMIPPSYTAPDFRVYQNKLSLALTKAIKDSGVKYVVDLSSTGAQSSTKGGPINGLHDNEARMNELEGINILHLRPCYFMENLFVNLGLIKNMNIMGSSLSGDLSMPMIATQDIAEAAAEHLLRLDFQGKSSQELLGQRNLTMNEVTKIIGKALKKENLSYVQFPYADAEKAMTQMGLSLNVAQLMNEMTRSMNEGTLKPLETRSPKNTTPTSIEEFAKTFAAVSNSSDKTTATA